MVERLSEAARLSFIDLARAIAIASAILLDGADAAQNFGAGQEVERADLVVGSEAAPNSWLNP
jgi:hypothetical protein